MLYESWVIREIERKLYINFVKVVVAIEEERVLSIEISWSK